MPLEYAGAKSEVLMQVLHRGRSVAAAAVLLITAVLAGSASGLLATCGPFTDAAGDAFCPFILEIFYLGITTGTTRRPTIPAPTSPASRWRRSSRERWTEPSSEAAAARPSTSSGRTQNATVLGLTTASRHRSLLVQSDGADLWVSQQSGNAVSRVAEATGSCSRPGPERRAPRRAGRHGPSPRDRREHTRASSTQINPSQPAGAVTTVASNLGDLPPESRSTGRGSSRPTSRARFRS